MKYITFYNLDGTFARFEEPHDVVVTTGRRDVLHQTDRDWDDDGPHIYHYDLQVIEVDVNGELFLTQDR